MTEKCPKCGYTKTKSASGNDCEKCGLIFSKYKSTEKKDETKPPLPATQKPPKSFRLLGIILFLAVAIGIAGLIIFLPEKESFRGYETEGAQDHKRGLSINVIDNYSSEKRVALIIGNGAYNSASLRNPVNDARLMKNSLKILGFDISYGENLSRKEMKTKIASFGRKLSSCGTGLFYYAGHGIQVKGRNYLLPVNENISTEEDVEFEGIDVSRVLRKMLNAGNRINIVILDACRNNPFARNSRSAERGLAYINAPSGTFIAYATGPGSVASDGSGLNSIYTKKLAHYMQIPQIKIEEVFKKVRVSVRKATKNRQTPWESTSLVGDFYFNSGDKNQFQPSEQKDPVQQPSSNLTNTQYDEAPIKTGDDGIIDEDLAFSLFQAAKTSKQRLDFDKAKEQLKKALASIPGTSESYQDISDELYFYMPLYRAQSLLEKRQNVALEKTIAPMKEYIKNHKKRFEFIQAIDRMETSLAMLDNHTCVEITMQARNLLMEAQMFYADMGKCPTSEELYSNKSFKPKYPVEIVSSGDEVVTIKITDTSNRCRKGNVYAVSMPSLPSDGWQ